MTNSLSTTNTTNGLDVLALGATPSVSNSRYGSGASSAAGGGGSWFEALATAWGSPSSKVSSMRLAGKFMLKVAWGRGLFLRFFCRNSRWLVDGYINGSIEGRLLNHPSGV